MPPAQADSAARNQTAVLLLVYACTALLFVALWLSGRGDTLGVRVEKFTYPERSAELDRHPPRRPYAYRVLIPLFLQASVAIESQERRDEWSMRVAENSPIAKRVIQRYGVNPRFLPEFLVFAALQVGFVFGTAWLLRRLYGVLYDSPDARVDIAPVLAITMAMPIYRTAAYHYDLSQLFLFTAALYALSIRRWRWFYPLIALGFVNKETTCLISFAFVATQWRMLPRREILVHLVAQLAIFGLLRALIVFFFEPKQSIGPTNDALRDYLIRNLGDFARSDLFNILSIQLLLAFVLAVSLRHLYAGPFFLRRAMILFLPFTAAYLKGGVWMELRVMGDILPLIFMLFYGGLLETIGRPLQVAADQVNSTPLFSDETGSARWVRTAWWLLLAALLFSVAAVPTFGRRILIEWLGL